MSHSLTPSEKNYSVHKLEFLVLKWAVIDKLKDYLYRATFVLKTDNNPLTYLLSLAKLDATGHKWLTAFSDFQFSLKYRPGSWKSGCRCLSHRLYWHTEESGDSAQWLKGVAEFESIGAHPSGVPKSYCDLSLVHGKGLPRLSKKDL